VLEGDDPGGGAFVLFLHPLSGAFRQLMCLHPGEFAQFFYKNTNAQGLVGGGGAWAPLELTGALYLTISQLISVTTESTC